MAEYVSDEELDRLEKLAGVELVPWQRDVIRRVLAGERVVMMSPRLWGRSSMVRVFDAATKRDG